MKRYTCLAGATFCVILIALACTSCTSLKVHHIGANDQARQPPGSIAYILPRKKIALSVTYVLRNCSTVLENGAPSLHLELDVTASAAASNEADPGQRYYIPYETLRSWAKETQVTLESYPNKTLKTLNVTINDQSAAITTAAIGTAVKLGALVAAGTPVGTENEMCSEEAIVYLQKVQTSKEKLASVAVVPKPDPNAGAADSAGKKPKVAPPAATQVPDSQITKIQSSIDQAVADHLTSKVVVEWIPRIGDLATWGSGIDAAALKIEPDQGVARWLTPKGIAWLSAHNSDPTNVYVLAAVPHWDRALVEPTIAEDTDGLVLRDPAVGALYLCKGACPVPNAGSAVVVNNTQSITAMAFPQLGNIVVVPLHNSMMQNSVLDVAVSEEGVITKLGLHHSSTAASSVKDVGSSFDSAKSVIDAQNKANDAAAAAAKTKTRDANKVLADCLDAQKTIIKDGGTPVGSCQ
jgi:hypothetical protein